MPYLACGNSLIRFDKISRRRPSDVYTFSRIQIEHGKPAVLYLEWRFNYRPVERIPFDDLDVLEAAAAIILEPVQGEGSARALADDDDLRAIRRMCSARRRSASRVRPL